MLVSAQAAFLPGRGWSEELRSGFEVGRGWELIVGVQQERYLRINCRFLK